MHYNEIFAENWLFHINAAEVISCSELKKVSRVKRLLCKLFNLTPNMEYKYTVKFTTRKNNIPENSSILLDERYNKWIVISSKENYFVAVCMPLKSFSAPINMVLHSKAFSE